MTQCKCKLAYLTVSFPEREVTRRKKVKKKVRIEDSLLRVILYSRISS